MFSDELFSDDSVAPESPLASGGPRRPTSRPLGFRRFGRIGFALVLIIGTFVGLTVEGVLTASPAFAAQANTCIDPATGGTATTFHAGVASYYTVECEEETGISGTSAYPTISIATDTLPGDGNPSLATGSSCTTTTSGSGATEEYIEECKFSDTPTAADESGTAYTATFTSTPGSFSGSTLTPATSGTLSVTINAPTVTCIDPASGGTASTFYEGSSNSYTVECEEQSGLSSITAYPSAIHIASGSLPADGNPTFATSTSSSPACTTGTSGSGATEEYILECALADTPTSTDGGSYPLTFTATGDGGVGSTTSGTLTVTISPPTTTCSVPASGGTSVSWVDGTAESETITCYSQGFAAANAGNYPASITLNSGTLPSDASEATSLSSSPACTTATSGSGTSEEYELECKITETPVPSDNGTYHVTFLATGGTNGAPNAVSGTLTITISQPAPSWETDGSTDGNYFSAIKGVPFCYDLAVTTSTSGGASSGSPYSLPLTSLTAGTTPANVSNYSLKNVNLAAGTAQICGTNNNTAASAPVTMAPVATNSGGSATDSIPLWSQNECTWTASGSTSVSMFDTNQDIEQAGSQSAFGQAISNGEMLGGANVGTENYPTCTGGVGVSASGGLGDAWTINTANPLPTPTDTNPSAAQGDLPSSNLDLASADSTTNYVGGCWGGTNILASTSTTSFGGGSSTAHLTLPSAWSNGGDCAYGSLGSNSAGGNTDTVNATCPPSQADVNAGYTNCGEIVSSGNDENGSTNYSTLALFFNGQPVPQTPTATISTGTILPGDTVSVTGGTNWWGDPNGAPDLNPTGDFQNDAADFYPVAAPGVYIGTSRATAVPVVDSTVTIPANTYVCTGAESTTVGPNPCTLTAGQPTGTFQVPSGLAPGAYNLYIDESNTSPLPGNGPNDAYQTAAGRNLGTVESATPIDVEGVMVVKTAATSYPDGGYSKAGDQITYSYAVTNNGPDTVTGITVNDNKIPSADITCPSSSLAGGASETCTGTYTVTQSDVDAGSVTNTATVSATTPSNEMVTSAPSSATVDASDATTSLSLDKTTTSTGYGAAGDSIPYNYLVTNTGSTTLNDIAVSDNLIPSVSCPDPTLASGTSETCIGTYSVTQSDVDAGSVTNTATASGTNDSNASATSNMSSVTVMASNAVTSLSLTKSTTSTGYGAAGDTIPYSYLVTNTGTTTLSGVGVSDNQIPSVSCPDSTLAPGANETCTGAYTVTQADVDAGSVTNTATANATGPYANTASSNQSSVTVMASNAVNSLSLTKSTSSNGYGAAGATIPYRYLVTNTGTTTLNDIAVSDNLIPSVNCPDSSLAPTASETCTATYTVTQADVDAGSVTNTATASGTNGSDVTATSNPSSVTVTANGASSGLAITKSTNSNGYGAAGDVIDYSYLVDNDGTTTLSSIAVTDNLVASVSCPDSSLAPTDSETCTGSYTVTQHDVDAGSVTNTAYATATDPENNTVTSGTSSITVLASNATSSLSISKSTNSSGYGAAGDVINYSYLVTNVGSTTLTSVGVTDNKVTSVDCPDSTLAPSASETCTGSYTVSQTDVDNGSVTNTAYAVATAPNSSSVQSGSSSITVLASGAVSNLSLTKSTTSTGYGAAGDTIPYSYLVTNTGSTTLSHVAVTDNKVASVDCPDSSLAPSVSETCTGTYRVTQADVNSGSVTNVATASGTNPQGTTVTSASSSVTVDVIATAPTVTTQPVSQYYNSGQSLTFTAAASGAPAPTVQWQYSTNGGSSWSNISGATSTTYTTGTLTSFENHWEVRAVFTNLANSATSNAATMTLATAPVVTTQPVSQYYNSGQSLTFTAAASGGPTPSVQWQYSTNGGSSWSNLSGATSTTFTTGSLTSFENHWELRAVFTNMAGSATSHAATVTLATAPVVTTQPVSQYYNSGQSLTFTAAASGGPDSQRAVAVLDEWWELVVQPLGSHLDHVHHWNAHQLREPLGAPGRVHQYGRLGHEQRRHRDTGHSASRDDPTEEPVLHLRTIDHLHGGSERRPHSQRAVAGVDHWWELVVQPLGSHLDHIQHWIAHHV